MNRRIIAIAAALVLAGCAGGPPPEPRVVTQRVEIPVPVACPDKRAAPADYPRTPAELKQRLAAEPNAVERVRKLMEWAPLWMERLGEDDAQVAACAKAPVP